MWRAAILVPLSLTFHLGFIQLMDPVAFFPLDGNFQTQESQGRLPAGVASNVTLAPGPDGNPDGSYELSMDRNSNLVFPNNGRLNTGRSITLVAWVNMMNSPGVLIWYPFFSSLIVGTGLRFDSQRLIVGLVTPEESDVFNVDQGGVRFSRFQEWVHLGMSFNHDTGESLLFIDGKRNVISNNQSLMLGTQVDILINFFGRVSQLYVFNVPLTEEQMQVLFQGCADLDNNIIVNVNCGDHGRDISITIDRIPDAEHWNGRQGHWRLNQRENASCAPTFGLCSVSYGRFNGSECTSVRTSSDSFIYTFIINTAVDLEDLSNRTFDHNYLITCRYPRNGTVQSSFVTLGAFEDGAMGSNALEFFMQLYTGISFEEILTGIIYPGFRIYVRVAVAHHFEENLDLLFAKCYISADHNGTRQRHSLIDNNGCDLGVTVNYNCSSQTNEVEYFSFEARRFADQLGNASVWLHCTVYACLSSSLCQTHCAGCSNRERRDNGDRSTQPIIYQLSSGPYTIVDREKGLNSLSDTPEETKDEPKTLAHLITILMVSGVVAVAIICATVVLVLRKRTLIVTISQVSASGKAIENQGFEATDINKKI